jgi:hypothetical protein
MPVKEIPDYEGRGGAKGLNLLLVIYTRSPIFKRWLEFL